MECKRRTGPSQLLRDSFPFEFEFEFECVFVVRGRKSGKHPEETNKRDIKSELESTIES
jgi:hypothetical protein